jgi:hypothetical protein
MSTRTSWRWTHSSSWTATPTDVAAADHAATGSLLHDELGVDHFADPDYFRWLYDENPVGSAIEGNRDIDGERAAHFAALPQRWRTADRDERFVFSLNAITRSTARGRGWFVELGREIYGKAAESGHVGVITVCNANSTPALTGKLEQRFRGALPVRLTIPLPGAGRGWTHHAVSSELLASAWFAELAGELDDHTAVGWTQCWTHESLRWRLRRPGADYTLHVHDDAVAVSTRDSVAGLPVAILLKILPRRGTSGLPGRAAVTAACAHHRTPACVYAGFNSHVRVRGVPIPVRMRPSPLNQLFGSLDPSVPESSFGLDTFEFLDSDDY